jgi:hypothetical protein
MAAAVCSNGEGRARHGPGPVGFGSPTRSTRTDENPAKGAVVASIVPQDGEPVSLRQALHDWWMAESDRRDRELSDRLNAWREGYAAGALAHADDYERGVHDGIIGFKKALMDTVEMARLQIRRYGPESRQFTDPQWGDFPGMFRGRGSGDAA